MKGKLRMYNRMGRGFLVCMRKILTRKSYWACCTIAFFLLFTASVGRMPDGKSLALWEYCFGDGIERTRLYCDSALWISFTKGSSWFGLFFPMISALCFSPVFHDEQVNGFIRYEVCRCGFYPYRISRFLSAIVSSGLLAVVAYLMFLLYVCVSFPGTSELSGETISYLRETQSYSTLCSYFASGFGVAGVYVLLVVEMFLFGVFAAIPALFALSFIHNPYLVVCLPFLLQYLQGQLARKLYGMAYPEIGTFHPGIQAVAEMIDPDYTRAFLTRQTTVLTICWSVGWLVVVFGVYLFRGAGHAEKVE